VAGGEADDLAQELLVHLAQDLGRQYRELVGTLRVIQPTQDALEDLVVQRQGRGQGVGLEVEEVGVVLLIGLPVQLPQAGVDLRATGETQERAIVLDAPVLAHAQKDDAVDGALHGEVELVDRQGRVAQGDVAGQGVAPALDLLQELDVHLGGAALASGLLYVAVEGALQHRFPGEDAVDVVEPVEVLVEGEVHDPAHADLVRGLGALAAVVDRELLEIGENAEGQLGAPGVAPQLIGRADVAFDRYRGLLGFQEELPDSTDAKAIVGRAGRPADLDGVLVDHVLVLLGVAPDVGHVPAQGLEEGVDELHAYAFFLVLVPLVHVQVGGEALHEPLDLSTSLVRRGCFGRAALCGQALMPSSHNR